MVAESTSCSLKEYVPGWVSEFVLKVQVSVCECEAEFPGIVQMVEVAGTNVLLPGVSTCHVYEYGYVPVEGSVLDISAIWFWSSILPEVN